jgi:probable rRNA maturation factor
LKDKKSMLYIQTEENLSFDDLGLTEKYIEHAALTVFVHEHADLNADLSIVLTHDARLHELNRQFMGIDAPTDVLSFPADLVDPDSQAAYLGDIIISVDRASAQAAAQGHTLAAEIILLVVHGTLHLLGHDHAEPADKARMWAAQAASLEQVAALTGIKPAFPPE